MTNLASDPLIVRLSAAIVKSGTRAPMLRSQVMDVSAFVRLFESWPDDSAITVKQLRMKAITLLAIALMLRPSDIAPQARCYDAESELSSRFVMCTDQVVFRSDGSVDISFFGVKNDLHRSGFVVHLPAGSQAKSDPVGALRRYIEHTEHQRCPVTKPVFLGLRRPHAALSASTVARVLEEAIIAAEEFGLPPGHRPKDFRPTGATTAVNIGVDADKVQQLGRWKTRSVFLDHYVHSSVPSTFSDDMFRC